MEASVLGGVILRNDVLGELVDLEVDDFYELKHKVVWQAIRNLEAKLTPIDVVTLEAEIEKAEKLDAIGGVAFLGELTLRVPTVDNVLVYRDEVRMLSRNRRAIMMLNDALEDAWNWPHDPREMVSEIGGKLSRLDELGLPSEKRIHLISVGEALEDLAQLAKCPRYPTPFPTLNEAIGFGGLLGTQVYTVAAGTGRGKTTWVAALAASVAEEVAPVLVVSYEMKPGYFLARRAAGRLGVHSNAIIGGEVDMKRVLAELPQQRLWLMHKPPLDDVRVAVRVLKERWGTPPLVIIDYIQKLADQIALSQQRPDLRIATSQASDSLCRIAEQSGACVVAVSATGRGKGKLMQEPRKFDPYDLVEVSKESGAVEYDGAGLIVLTLSKEQDDGRQVATMTVAKARFGETCHIDARYDGRRGEWIDRGRVEVVEKMPPPEKAAKPVPPKDEKDEDIRRKIIAELKATPARNKTNLNSRVRGSRPATVNAVLARLIDEGVVQEIKGAGLTLSIDGLQLAMELLK